MYLLVGHYCGIKCVPLCVCRWLKYINEAGDVYKESNPLKTPPQKPRKTQLPKHVMTVADVAEAYES